jgi:Protein of unknown function (DUF551).
MTDFLTKKAREVGLASDPEAMNDVSELVRRIESLAEKATPGPYFISGDDAADTTAHRNSGLALIDTGRNEDWPVLRLGEWPTTRFIAELLNAWPEIRKLLLEKSSATARAEAAEEARDSHMRLCIGEMRRAEAAERAWIPVSERLPDPIPVHPVGNYSAYVLCYCRGWIPPTYAMQAAFNGNGEFIGWVGQSAQTDCVTHWMPLPAPPDAALAAPREGGK